MRRTIARLVAAVATTVAMVPVGATGGVAQATPAHPNRVLIVLFDQMVPQYADQFDMPNFRALRGDGTYFKNAYLGYMGSETVISHNVITSGQLPKHMGWTDEAYRDTDNVLGFGAGAMHITGDLSLSDFGNLIVHEGYPKLADYLHDAYPGSKFIVVGQKSYAVESAVAPAGYLSSSDIAVRMSSRSASSSTVPVDPCRDALGGRYRKPSGWNVPPYLLTGPLAGPNTCGRWFINSDASNDYGTTAAFPSFMYPEDGNRFIEGTDLSTLPENGGHVGGDTWVADAAIAMMGVEPWSGMFVTLGSIDKTGHMWGAQADAASFTGSCTEGTPTQIGAAQTHVRCAAENADVQLGKLMAAVTELDASDGGETLVVLTADHGATYGAGDRFRGKTTSGAGDSNWYYAPQGVWDGGVFVDPNNCTPVPPATTCTPPQTYNQPSSGLATLKATNNIEFSYQSTGIETWLSNRAVPKMKEGAAAMLQTPGVIASYWHDGNRYRLYGTKRMTGAEKSWWKMHGQEIVNSMAASNGPDLIGLLQDYTSYGVYGDHGGAQRTVQQVPVVFWSPSLAFQNNTGAPFRTPDIMPTILQAMGIPVTSTMDGRARSLG